MSSEQPRIGLATRPQANRIAVAIFAVTLGVALLVLLWPLLFEGAGRFLAENPFVPARTAEIVTKRDGNDMIIETVVTDKDVSASLLERTFAASGLLILRVGAALLVAFAAAALVRRVLIGDFRFRAGPVDLSQDEAAVITRETAGRTAELDREFRELVQETRVIALQVESSRDRERALAVALDKIGNRLDRIEKQISGHQDAR